MFFRHCAYRCIVLVLSSTTIEPNYEVKENTIKQGDIINCVTSQNYSIEYNLEIQLIKIHTPILIF